MGKLPRNRRHQSGRTHLPVINLLLWNVDQAESLFKRIQCYNSTNVTSIKAIKASGPRKSNDEVQQTEVVNLPRIRFGILAPPNTCSPGHCVLSYMCR